MSISKVPVMTPKCYWQQRCQKAEHELEHMLEWAERAMYALDYSLADRDEMDDIAQRLAEITGGSK